jgi:hypothetical protein
MTKAAAVYLFAAFGYLLAFRKNRHRLQNWVGGWVAETAKPSISREEREQLRLQTIDGWFFRTGPEEKLGAEYLGRVRIIGSTNEQMQHQPSFRPISRLG